MVSGICGISYNISKANRTDGRVQNLAAHIDKETLKTIHRKMKPNKASGIDKVTKEEYDANLETNLDKLIDRMKRYVYRPNPSRRIYILKSGSNKMRPLGISCYEDKLVENAIAQILIPIYEQKFITTSYGFRPNRNCHMAVREIIEIIQRFLKAGVMENGKYLDSEKGTPQGNGASPVLANIYLHYVLDLWFEKRVKNRTKGQCYLIRYADDFICCFQNKAEAERFQEELRERLRKFGLELAEEKTKIIEFGRFARENRKARGEGKPETFDFLGFTFYCGKANKKGFFRCRVRTSKKKYRSKIKAMKEWIKTHRTMPLKEMFEKLSAKLRGHYQYYGVTDNSKSIKSFYTQTQWLLYKWLNRRSQKRSYTTQTFFDGLLKTFTLPEPKIYVSLFYRQVQI